MTTHTDLARWAAPPALAALRGAAAESAFPQVRNVATIGGNICAAGFAEADLVPALLALAARVHRMRAGREETVGLAEHIATRLPGTLVLAAELDVPPADVRSGFARLTVRGGGEYAVCSVALAVRRDDRGSVTSARIAVGSVETMARRCPDAEAALVGAPLTAESARTAGTVAASTLVPRDGHDAPGWYRTAVLPTLLQRAAARAVGEETR
jgi:carbon-monoxide dehydrogenase medium subunit